MEETTAKELDHNKLANQLIQEPDDFSPCWVMVIRRYDNVPNRHLDDQLVIIPIRLIHEDMEVARPNTMKVIHRDESSEKFSYFASIAAVSNKHKYITNNMVRFLEKYFESFHDTEKSLGLPLAKGICPTSSSHLCLNYDRKSKPSGPFVLVAFENNNAFEIMFLTDVSVSNRRYFSLLEKCQVKIMRNFSKPEEKEQGMISLQATEGRIVAVSMCREYLERNIEWMTKRFALKKELEDSKFHVEGQKVALKRMLDYFYQSSIDEHYLMLAKMRSRLKELVIKRRKIISASRAIAAVVEHIGKKSLQDDLLRGKYDGKFEYIIGYIAAYPKTYRDIVGRVVNFLRERGFAKQHLLEVKVLKVALAKMVTVETIRELDIGSLIEDLKSKVGKRIDPPINPLKRTSSLPFIADKDEPDENLRNEDEPLARRERRASIC